MKNQPSKIRRSTKIITAIWVTIVVAIAAIWSYSAIKEHLETPKNLGPQLEYIGKDDYGCQWWMIISPCSSMPGTIYYFATNLSEENLVKYFKRAKINPKYEVGYSGNDWEAKILYFENGSQNFTLTTYNNTKAIITDKNLGGTDKNYVISIDKKWLAKAEAAL